MASLATNNRSLCGIVEFDDGAGGLLSGGTLSCQHMDTTTSEFDHIEVKNNLDLQGTLTVADLVITPTWLSYLYGLTGNIQQQLSAIIAGHLNANNLWTGVNTFANQVYVQATLNGFNAIFSGTLACGQISSPTITGINSSLTTKLNAASGTTTNMTLTGPSNFLTGILNLPQDAAVLFYHTTNSVSHWSSRFMLTVLNNLYLDNRSTNLFAIRWGVSNIERHTFFPNGDLTITGALVSPTVTGINANITNISTATATNTSNITTNTTNITANTTAIATNTSNITLNTASITANTTAITANSTAITSLQNNPTTVAAGVTLTGHPGTNATVTNVGTSQNMVLDFVIPRGKDGSDGSNGSKGDKGNTGDTGPAGGDGGGAALGAAAGGAAGAISGTASGAVAGAAAGSSAGAVAAGATMAALQPQIVALESAVSAIEVELTSLATAIVDTESELAALEEEILVLQEKTAFQTAGPATTIFGSSLECGNIASTGTISSVWGVESTDFSGGTLPTNVTGSIINVGVTGSLVGDINIGKSSSLVVVNGSAISIGNASSVTTINGVVFFTNPFNEFFAQY